MPAARSMLHNSLGLVGYRRYSIVEGCGRRRGSVKYRSGRASSNFRRRIRILGMRERGEFRCAVIASLLWRTFFGPSAITPLILSLRVQPLQLCICRHSNPRRQPRQLQVVDCVSNFQSNHSWTVMNSM